MRALPEAFDALVVLIENRKSKNEKTAIRAQPRYLARRLGTSARRCCAYQSHRDTTRYTLSPDRLAAV